MNIVKSYVYNLAILIVNFFFGIFLLINIGQIDTEEKEHKKEGEMTITSLEFTDNSRSTITIGSETLFYVIVRNEGKPDGLCDRVYYLSKCAFYNMFSNCCHWEMVHFNGRYYLINKESQHRSLVINSMMKSLWENKDKFDKKAQTFVENNLMSLTFLQDWRSSGFGEVNRPFLSLKQGPVIKAGNKISHVYPVGDLGEGGFKTVKKGYNIIEKRLEAIAEPIDQSAKDWLIEECNITKVLQSCRISKVIKIYQEFFEQENGLEAFSMELCKGDFWDSIMLKKQTVIQRNVYQAFKNLLQLNFKNFMQCLGDQIVMLYKIKKIKDHTPEEKKKLFMKLLSIAETVNEMHRNHYVHCDLKFNNVLLTESDDICLTDFGLTVKKDSYCDPRGTPVFMAPELLEATDVLKADPKWDTWAFGVMLYLLEKGSYLVDDTTIQNSQKKREIAQSLRSVLNTFNWDSIQDVNLKNLIRGLLKDRWSFDEAIPWLRQMV